MDKRFFIREALEAALAAKNFGFKYYTKLLNVDDVNWIDAGCYVNMRGSWMTDIFYIADESLPLLEPVVGDTIMIHPHRFLFVSDNYADEMPDAFTTIAQAKEFIAEGSASIILRNNLHFPKIEVDDDE